MPFDIKTAKPIDTKKFDIKSAIPVERTGADFLLPSGLTKYQEQPGELTAIGELSGERLGAGVRSMLQGKGLSEGLRRPEQTPKFQDIWLDKYWKDTPPQANELSSFLKTWGGQYVSAAGLATDIYSNPVNAVLSLPKQTVGIIGRAGEIVAKPAISFGKFIAKDVAALSPRAIETLGKFGVKTIKEFAKRGGTVLSKTIIPEAKKRVAETIANLGDDAIDLLEDMGFKPDDVNDILKISKERLSTFANSLSESSTATYNALENSRKAVGKAIGKIYDIAEKNGNTIRINNTIRELKTQLRNKGFLNIEGKLTPEAKTTKSQTLKALSKIFEEYGQPSSEGLTIPQYKNLLAKLEASLKADEQFNTAVYPVIKTLRNDAITELEPLFLFRKNDLGKLNKDYSDLLSLRNLFDKIDNIYNTKPENIETSFKKLTGTLNDFSRDRYSRIYGQKLLDQLDILNAADEFYLQKRYWSPVPYFARKATLFGTTKGKQIREATKTFSKFPSKSTETMMRTVPFLKKQNTENKE